ncbi:MAG: hypothetical protein U9R06_03435 [Patescibacteria group bacterium]|nr:hypothetical protein [Patescibacteria group bacterium]
MAGKKQVIFQIFLLFLILSLSGCSLAKQLNEEDNNWQDEIVYAEECGLDGLPCCPEEKGLPCQYGQVCCADPNDPKKNRCVDDCGCGGENEYCCLNNQCDSGLACLNGDCVVCGGSTEPCCQNDEEQCSGDLMCYNNFCLECGLAGNPCCGGENACKNQELRNNDRTECFGGVCQKCGSDRQRICLKEPACNLGQILNVDSCLSCGGFNQPCCNESSGLGYECLPDSGLVCHLGFCNK